MEDKATLKFGNYTINELNEVLAMLLNDFYQGNYFSGDSMVPKVGQLSISQFNAFVDKLYADLY